MVWSGDAMERTVMSAFCQTKLQIETVETES
jgi:hypothetical protein